MRGIALLAASAAMIGSASAADINYGDTPVSYKDAPYTPAPIWTGMYVGGHLGGVWNDGGESSAWKKWKCRWCGNEEPDWKENPYIKLEDEDDDTAFIAGVHVGYNWQSGSTVAGIEGDVSFADGFDYLASLRLRLGYAYDSLLLYVTGGVAFAALDDSSVDFSVGRYDGTIDFSGDNEVGFVVGAGAEYKLNPNWSLGVEGLYYAFGDSTDTFNYQVWCWDKKIDHEDDNDLFVVRGRLTYHFQEEEYVPLK